MAHKKNPWGLDTIAAAFTAALLLSSCGGGGGGGGGSAAVSSTPPAQTPTPPSTVAGAFDDSNTYDSSATGSLAAPNESAAVIASHIQLNGKQFDYTATSGHLTATDAQTGKSASLFYVAYTTAAADPAQRPLTFFYNGGPGSASLWLHLGSFGPRRLVSTIPSATIAPAQLVDNQETLLANSDLVFIDAVGTGYSQAIAPSANADFWSVDKDAASFRDFVLRYIAVNKRGASPKYLYGESYGAPRTAVLANLLETAGVQLNGIMLQSSIMNYNSNCGVLDPGVIGCEGYVPSYAAIGAYYQRSTPSIPADFGAYVQQARAFADGDYHAAMTAWLASKATAPAGVFTQLVNFTGIPTAVWLQNFDLGPDKFQSAVLPGQLVGRYDARVSAGANSGLAAGGDPSLAVVNDNFVSTISSYVAGELHYTARSGYVAFVDIVNRWNFSHDGKGLPDTVPDLAAALAQNPGLKVLSLNGYDDLATPFHQTELDLGRLGASQPVSYKYYSSGHMIYLDDIARRAQQLDLINFYLH